MSRGPEFRLVARNSGRSESEEARYARNQHSTRQDPIDKYTSCKVTPDGIVKMLDFGIAKMRAPDEAAVEASTVTIVRTRAGALLGTAAYMSPEQARGQAHVLEHEPAWDMLPPATPPQVRRLLQRCLGKPKERLRDIGDARIDLDERSGIVPEPPRIGLLGSRRAIAFWAVLDVEVAL
jgi:hypothetical protein